MKTFSVFSVSSASRVRARARALGAAACGSWRQTVLAVLAVGVSACASQPVEWLDAEPIVVALDGNTTRAAALYAVLDTTEASQRTVASADPLPAITTPPAPNTALGNAAEPGDSARCSGSLVTERTPRGDVAVWWSERSQRRVFLLAAWRDAGVDTWRGPIPVDTFDQGPSDARDLEQRAAVGCDRPPPGLSVDAVNGYVHVAYALSGPSGPGIFYAHQMDPRGSFEPAIPIVYGERLGAARVGSDGDLTAVAYEDPNSGTRIRIGLAVSRTAGHVFERRITVNDGTSPAADPYIVARGAALAVGWRESPPMGGDPKFLVRRAALPLAP